MPHSFAKRDNNKKGANRMRWGSWLAIASSTASSLTVVAGVSTALADTLDKDCGEMLDGAEALIDVMETAISDYEDAEDEGSASARQRALRDYVQARGRFYSVKTEYEAEPVCGDGALFDDLDVEDIPQIERRG